MSAPVRFAWEDGALRVRTSLRDVSIRWRPAPRAEESDHGRSVRECWPEFRLLRPPDAPADDAFFDLGPQEAAAESARGPLAEQKARAFDALREALPQELTVRAEGFPSHQWGLLQLMHGRPEVRDLAATNPVLAFALANNGEFRRTAPDVAAAAAQRHCVHRQRDIAGWLGFPATEAVVRLLRKVPAEAATITRLRLLRRLLCTRPARTRTLSTLPRINAGVIDLVGMPRFEPFLTDALLQQVVRHPAEEREGQVAPLFRDVLRMEAEIRRPLSRDEVRSIASAHHLHEEAMAAYLEHVERVQRAERERQAETERRREAALKRKREQASGRAPPPPLPAGDGIVPLTTKADMLEESRQQENCVGGYFRRVCRGGCYIYRVTRPQRATLCIRRGAGGRWFREELKAACNAGVRRETELAVDLWLARAQEDLARRGAAPPPADAPWDEGAPDEFEP